MRFRRQLAAVGSRLPRSTVIVIGCLLLGLAIGTVISSVAMSRRAPRVGEADYVLMVADLFDHEKSVFNARERLAVLSRPPVDLADAALETYAKERPEDRRGLDALRQLDQSLRQAEADARGARASTSPGAIGVLGLMLTSVLFAAGVAWAWKVVETRGLRLPRVPRGDGSESKTPNLGRGMVAAFTTVTDRARQRRPTVTAHDDELATPARPVPARRGGLGSIELPPPLDGGRRLRRPIGVPSRPQSEEPQSELRVFETHYSLGDDPYDEAHEIYDVSGELVGVCGLSATEPSDRPGRYFGFTAWLQDHGRPGEMAAVGLVTRSGQTARSAAIAEWRRRGTVDDVQVIDRGVQLGLRTRRIDAVLTVVDFDYTPAAHGSPGYFGFIAVRLEVGPAS